MGVWLIRSKHKFTKKHLEIILMNQLKGGTHTYELRTNTCRPKKRCVRPKIYSIGQRDYKTRINNPMFAL